MAVGGICMRCGNFSPALYTCKACGSRCCPRCVDARTGFCLMCGGMRTAGAKR